MPMSPGLLALSRASMAKSTVYGRWGLRHLNFVFICRMATRLRMKLRIELFFTVIKSFWSVHVQVLAEIFAQRWAISLSQRLVTEAKGLQRQPWSNWTFLMKRNRLATLEWSPTTMAVPFRFHVIVGLKLAAQRARAKQNRARWQVLDDEGDEGDDQVCVLGGARRGRDARGVWRRGRHPGRGGRVLWARRSVGRGVGRGRGRAQGRGRGLGRGNAVDGNASSVGNYDAQPLTWDVVNLGESEPRDESIPLRELDAHFPWYCKLKGNSTFQAVLSGTSSWSVFQGLWRSVRPKTKLWTTIWSTLHSLKLMSLVLLESVWNTLSEYIYIYRLLLAILHHKKVTASKQKLAKSALFPHT